MCWHEAEEKVGFEACASTIRSMKWAVGIGRLKTNLLQYITTSSKVVAILRGTSNTTVLFSAVEAIGAMH